MRLFIAFDVPFNIRQKVLRLRERINQVTRRIRLTDKENMHITVKFLGEQSEAALKRIMELLKKQSKHLTKFRIDLNKAGVFKSLERPQVIWLGEDNEDFVYVSNKINEQLNIFRPFDNKPFCHLTIGRIKYIPKYELLKCLDICRDFIQEEDLSFDVGELYLYESRLYRSGAVYSKIEKFNLRES